MFPRFPTSRRSPEADRAIFSESAALAERRAHRTPPAVSPEESRKAEREILRRVYDEAVEGGLAPAPGDLTGSRLGAIRVLGPAEAGQWTVHNPRPTAGVAQTYTVSHEALLASYANGELTLAGVDV